MSFAGLNTHNYSFFAVPVGWALAMAPHFYAVALYNKERAPGSAEWDNSNPKKNNTDDGLKSAKLSPFMTERYLRAEAANNNSHVTLPLFAAAIVAGNYARLSPRFLNLIAGSYLLSRVAYTWLYINGTSKLGGNLRSGAYLWGVITAFAAFVQAGRKLL